MLTVRDSIWDAGQKVLAVVVGLVVAIWLGGLIGLHAWSISVIVAVGFLAGKILRLQPGAAAQIPITGLFVLALGSDLIAERFLDTLIGAATAVLVNLAIAPPNHVNAAAKSMIALADDVVDELNEMSAGIASRWSLRQAVGWLEAARRHRGPAMMAADDVRQAEQSLQLRPGRAAWTPALVRLQRATDTLLVVEVQVRVIARTLRDTAEKVPTTGRAAAADAHGVRPAARHGRRDRGVRAQRRRARQGRARARSSAGRRAAPSPVPGSGSTRSTATSATCWRRTCRAASTWARWSWRRAASSTSWSPGSTPRPAHRAATVSRTTPGPARSVARTPRTGRTASCGHPGRCPPRAGCR